MAKALAIPTPLIFRPGTSVQGATTGVDWVWNVAFAGADIPNGPSGSENVIINIVAADIAPGALTNVRDKLQTAIIALALKRYGATVTGPDILMASMQFGV